jgi:hypothetical protein
MRFPVKASRDAVKRQASGIYRRCVSVTIFGGAHVGAPARIKCTNLASSWVFKSDSSLLGMRTLSPPRVVGIGAVAVSARRVTQHVRFDMF